VTGVQSQGAMHVMALDSNHVWKATPGCRILIVDGGAVRFDYPAGWLVHSRINQILLLDRLPPDQPSYLGLRWRKISRQEAALPLKYLVANSAVAEQRPIVKRSSVLQVLRPPLEAAWVQHHVVDGNRLVGTRMCVARGGCTQAIVLAEFAVEDELAFFPVWDTFLKTLAVGDYIADPTTGRLREQRG
jgi:hypothetical protein